MKPCRTCPFLENSENYGNSDWFIDVCEQLEKEQLTHSCHRTDPRADGYVNHKDGKDSICWGAVGMLKAEKNSCQDSRVMMMLVEGTIDWGNVETKDCFKSVKSFLKHHSWVLLSCQN